MGFPDLPQPLAHASRTAGSVMQQSRGSRLFWNHHNNGKDVKKQLRSTFTSEDLSTHDDSLSSSGPGAGFTGDMMGHVRISWWDMNE